jgi:hypothetical protein
MRKSVHCPGVSHFLFCNKSFLGIKQFLRSTFIEQIKINPVSFKINKPPLLFYNLWLTKTKKSHDFHGLFFLLNSL